MVPQLTVYRRLVSNVTYLMYIRWRRIIWIGLLSDTGKHKTNKEKNTINGEIKCKSSSFLFLLVSLSRTEWVLFLEVKVPQCVVDHPMVSFISPVNSILLFNKLPNSLH